MLNIGDGRDATRLIGVKGLQLIILIMMLSMRLLIFRSRLGGAVLTLERTLRLNLG